MNRKLLIMRLMLMNGEQRGRYLKKIRYFHKQGENCYFQPYNFGTEPYLLEFGDNVSVASGVRFVNHDIASFVFNHVYAKNMPTRVKPISVGNNVFIGCDSVILPGVHIGNNVIIGGGSVVSKDIPDNSLAVGVPCKVIGKFEDYYQKYCRETSSYTWKQDSADKSMKMVEYFYGNENRTII